ncbi:MAG TPA: outer membrane protein assembly factor, partial [Gemmatimonadales bacterium]|nr:outer membrane protein assembly factor [Gemmatimonadales bacterium]
HFLHDDVTSDTINYGIGLTLRQPAFFSPRHTASLGVFAERRSEFKAYTRQAVGGNAAVILNGRRNVPVTLGYGFSVGRTTADAAVYCSVFRVCDARDRDLLARSRRFGAVTISGVRDQVNSVLDPSAGSLVTASLMHASRLVGSDTLYEFNRGQFELSYYYPLGRRGVLAWRALAGTIVPARRIALAGQSVHFIPPDQRFYGGGPNSVRGYARNELGPRVYVTNDTTGGVYRNVTASPIGGNSIVVMNAEVRLPTPLFPDRIRLALFVDAGQVWERGGDPGTVTGVRVTPGVGLRFTTPLGPVRLDAAYNGYPAEPGPLYFQDNTSLTLVPNVVYQPGLSPGFWRRVIVQFAVGQAF